MSKNMIYGRIRLTIEIEGLSFDEGLHFSFQCERLMVAAAEKLESHLSMGMPMFLLGHPRPDLKPTLKVIFSHGGIETIS